MDEKIYVNGDIERIIDFPTLPDGSIYFNSGYDHKLFELAPEKYQDYTLDSLIDLLVDEHPIMTEQST